MYLLENTYCELSFANHQCRRFSINPHKQNGTALKPIGRYLLGSVDKGTIVCPTDELILNCYAVHRLFDYVSSRLDEYSWLLLSCALILLNPKSVCRLTDRLCVLS
jgi:hypothetical protein